MRDAQAMELFTLSNSLQDPAAFETADIPLDWQRHINLAVNARTCTHGHERERLLRQAHTSVGTFFAIHVANNDHVI